MVFRHQGFFSCLSPADLFIPLAVVRALVDTGEVCGDLVLTDKADVVVANITADILLRLCEKLRTLLRKGGVVIISGIIHARAEEVKSEYGKYFDIIKIVKKGEWQAMSLKKRV